MIRLEWRGPAAWVVIDRPEALNALNAEAHRRLREALKKAEDDEEVRVVVITGSGEKAFCAGADVKDFIGAQPYDVRVHVEESRKTIDLILRLNKPVVAAVNGLALGTGCEIVLACDLAIASENAKFGQPEVRLGMMPGLGATQRLPLLVGVKKAKELLMTGKLIDAREAERLGIVNKVVPPDKLKDEVDRLVEELSKLSSSMLRLIKDAVNRPLEALLGAGLSIELECFAESFSLSAPHEGIKAFLEKRKAEFKE
ncbi:MAG: hypothetical protein DRJ97_04110 [Thermoprotei archaeon]|nr:MAG: hypothetical protein DRJ97_04110 [Thermoprotei archaeon]